MRNLRRTTCLMALISAMSAGALKAQDAPINLGTIYISPNYWEELAQEAAVSASILEGAQLGARNSRDLDAVVANSANVVFQRANSTERLVVRGLSAFDNSLADPVGYQVNGVSLPLGTIQLPHFFATEQVSLLRGPQGTTAGRNASAGLLVFDTIEPGSLGGWRAGIGISGSDAGAQGIGGHVSLLYSDWVDDRVALTFGLELSGDQGVISDPIGDDNGGENQRLNAVLGLAWDLENGGRLSFNTVLERQDFNKEQFRYIAGPLATARYESSYSVPSQEDRFSSVSSLQYTQSFDAFELTTITGFTSFDRDFTLDFDASRLPVGISEFDIEDRMVSQEIRLNSHEGSGPLQWSAGLHMFRQDTDVEFNLSALGTNRRTEIEQTGIALYGFGEYAVTDRFSIGAGLRLDWIESSGQQTLVNGFGTSTYSGSDSSLTVLPKFTASYRLPSDAIVYGSLSRGYMPAGYNYGFATDASSLTYDAEYSWAAEIGYRQSFDNGAALSLAAFYTRVDDKQITETIPGAAQRISNAAEMETYGVELELDAPLGNGWQIGANLGWQRARATSFNTTVFNPGLGGLVAVDYSGNDLPFAPEVTYGLSLGYDGGNGWSGEVALNGSGSYFFDAGNTLAQDGFSNLSLRINRELGAGVLTLWADNLLDEEYYAVAANTFRGVVVEDGAPRRFGLNYSVEW